VEERDKGIFVCNDFISHGRFFLMIRIFYFLRTTYRYCGKEDANYPKGPVTFQQHPRDQCLKFPLKWINQGKPHEIKW
jgi:hypothetical protein